MKNLKKLSKILKIVKKAKQQGLKIVTTNGTSDIHHVGHARNLEFAGVFGSYARGENRPESDIDILVRFSEPKSFFDLVGLEIELSEKLGRKVEIISEKYLHPYLHSQVSEDLKVFYGERRYL